MNKQRFNRKKLLELIEAQGTLTNFAQQVDVTKQAASLWTFEGYPSIATLLRISNTFGVSIADFFTDENI